MITLKMGATLTQYNTYVLTVTYEDGHAVFDFPMDDDLCEEFKLCRFVEALLLWREKWMAVDFSDLDFSKIFNTDFTDSCVHPEIELEEFHDIFHRQTWDSYDDRPRLSNIAEVDLTYWDDSGILHRIEIERKDL